jgi:hypothetical protein
MAIHQCRLCHAIVGCADGNGFRYCVTCDFFPLDCVLLMYPELFGIKKTLCRACINEGARWFTKEAKNGD